MCRKGFHSILYLLGMMLMRLCMSPMDRMHRLMPCILFLHSLLDECMHELHCIILSCMDSHHQRNQNLLSMLRMFLMNSMVSLLCMLLLSAGMSKILDFLYMIVHKFFYE